MSELLWPVGVGRTSGRERWPVLAAWLALPASVKRACQEARIERKKLAGILADPAFVAMVRQAQEVVQDQAAKRAVLRLLERAEMTAMPRKGGGREVERPEAIERWEGEGA